MKRLAVTSILFVLAVLFVAPARAQQPADSSSPQAAASTSPPAKPSGKLITLAGIITADRKAFLCDKDNRTLLIANPEVLRGIEGQHATLRARLDSASHALVVASAKPSRDERHAPRLDDAAFRK